LLCSITCSLFWGPVHRNLPFAVNFVNNLARGRLIKQIEKHGLERTESNRVFARFLIEVLVKICSCVGQYEARSSLRLQSLDSSSMWMLMIVLERRRGEKSRRERMRVSRARGKNDAAPPNFFATSASSTYTLNHHNTTGLTYLIWYRTSLHGFLSLPRILDRQWPKRGKRKVGSPGAGQGQRNRPQRPLAVMTASSSFQTLTKTPNPRKRHPAMMDRLRLDHRVRTGQLWQERRRRGRM